MTIAIAHCPRVSSAMSTPVATLLGVVIGGAIGLIGPVILSHSNAREAAKQRRHEMDERRATERHEMDERRATERHEMDERRATERRQLLRDLGDAISDLPAQPSVVQTSRVRLLGLMVGDRDLTEHLPAPDIGFGPGSDEYRTVQE